MGRAQQENFGFRGFFLPFGQHLLRQEGAKKSKTLVENKMLLTVLETITHVKIKEPG